MSRTERVRSETALKPIGVALAAVVAGLGTGAKARAPERPEARPLEPTVAERTHFVDPTNHPSFEEDPTLILGPSTPLAPFGEKPGEAQPDLFSPDVPLGRAP